MTPSQQETAQITPPAPAPAIRWKAWLLPSFCDWAFVFVLCFLYVWHAKWNVLFADGDTGWHIRTGQYILANHLVPHQDLFSFSKPGAPWFAWEWLSDVCLAALYGWGGLKAIAIAAGTIVAAIPVVLLRIMASRGMNGFVAWITSIIAFSVANIHFLARPHLVTLLFVPISLWLLERDRQTPSPAVWLLVPLTALWVNLHGGFAILLGLLGLLVAGQAAETALVASSRDWKPLKRYGALFALCLAASFVNPYGWRLHQHIVDYLRSDFIRSYVVEFQSPSFRSESMLVFEVFLFAILAVAGRMLSRSLVTEPLWIFALTYLSLASVRHVPLCVVALAPILAQELSVLWSNHAGSQPPKAVSRIVWELGNEIRAGFDRNTILPILFVICLTFLVPSQDWPTDFPAPPFPTAIVRKHQALLARSRVFTSDQWGDYLIFLSYPAQRVYIDGRSDFYGSGIGSEYMALVMAREGWRKVLKERSFDLILCPPDWPLATLLKESLNWRVADDDGKAILFMQAPSK